MKKQIRLNISFESSADSYEISILISLKFKTDITKSVVFCSCDWCIMGYLLLSALSKGDEQSKNSHYNYTCNSNSGAVGLCKGVLHHLTKPGLIGQSVTCLAADMCLTA